MSINKKAIAMPFNWIFTIIVGTVILFLAIYGVSKFIGTSEYQVYTESAAKLESLLNPLGTGLASGKSTQIIFKKDVRTYYTCSELGIFGKNTIAFSEKTFGDFGDEGGAINSKKYIFAEDVVEGKTLNLFSKPFSMGFKIDDIIMISSENYCFYQAPNNVREEIEGLNLENINIAEDVDDLNNCSGKRVCFGADADCDIFVFGMCEDYTCDSIYDYGKVIKRGKTLYYDGGLLYAAIVSSPEIYDCNLKRLMKRFNELSLVYIDKIKIIEMNGCSSNIGGDLIEMAGLARDLESSEDLFILSQRADVIDMKNKGAICGLW